MRDPQQQKGNIDKPIRSTSLQEPSVDSCSANPKLPTLKFTRETKTSAILAIPKQFQTRATSPKDKIISRKAK